MCRETIDVSLMGRDLTAHKIIQDLPVKCCNNKCTWEGTLEKLEAHYKNCKYTVTPDWVKNPPNCIKIEEEDTPEPQKIPSKNFPLVLPWNIQPLFQYPSFSGFMNMPCVDNNYVILLQNLDLENSLTFHSSLQFGNPHSLNYTSNDSNFLIQEYCGQSDDTSEINGFISDNSYRPVYERNSTKNSSKSKKKKKSGKNTIDRKLSTRTSFDDESDEEEYYPKVSIKEKRRTSKRKGNKEKMLEAEINVGEVKKKVKSSS